MMFGKFPNGSPSQGIKMVASLQWILGQKCLKMSSIRESILEIDWQTWTMPTVFRIREVLSCSLWSMVAFTNTFFAFNCWSAGEVPFGGSALAISSKTGNVFVIPLRSAQKMSQMSWHRALQTAWKKMIAMTGGTPDASSALEVREAWKNQWWFDWPCQQLYGRYIKHGDNHGHLWLRIKVTHEPSGRKSSKCEMIDWMIFFCRSWSSSRKRAAEATFDRRSRARNLREWVKSLRV